MEFKFYISVLFAIVFTYRKQYMIVQISVHINHSLLHMIYCVYSTENANNCIMTGKRDCCQSLPMVRLFH